MTTGVLTRGGSRVRTTAVAPGAGRLAALMALASAVVHVLAVTSPSPGSALMAGLALACLPCAWHLWQAPTVAVWTLTAMLDLSMLALHAPTGLATPGHDAGHAPAAGHVHGGEPMSLALVLVVGSLALCTLALTTAALTRAHGDDGG